MSNLPPPSQQRREFQALAEEAAALECAGRWEAAEHIHVRLFQETLRAGDPEGMANALRSQSRVRECLGRTEEAEELALLSLEVAERHGLSAAAARATNAMAVFRHRCGDLDAAKQLFRHALDGARNTQDDQLIGFVCQNLGIIANVQGDLREAQALYLESVGAAVRSGDRIAAMMAYNNLGMVNADLHEWMEAEIYFSRGIEIAEQLGDVSIQAKLYVNRVEPLIQFGELARASAALDRAHRFATQVEDRGVLSDVARFRAVIARLNKDFSMAERQLLDALEIATGAQLELERGEVLEEMARLRRTEGRGGAAKVVLREARRVYEALQAERDLLRVDRLREDWEEEDNRLGTSGSPA